MRISLWREFASNHSNNFTVVGEFTTPQAARLAADKLLDILRTVSDWHKKYPYGYKKIKNRELSPPEIILAEHYEIEWTKSIDFFWYGDESSTPASLVHVIGNHVLFGSPKRYETWTSQQPFIELFQKLGGYAKSEAEYEQPDTILFVNLKCRAPSKDVAIDLMRAASYSIGSLAGNSEPWIAYVSDIDVEKRSDIIETSRLKREALIAKCITSGKILNMVSSEIEFEGNKAIQIEMHYQDVDVDQNQVKTPTPLSSEQEKLLSAIRRVDIILGYVNLLIDGKESFYNLYLNELMFSDNIVYTLPAMILWLEDNGCSEIEYEFDQKDYSVE